MRKAKKIAFLFLFSSSCAVYVSVQKDKEVKTDIDLNQKEPEINNIPDSLLLDTLYQSTTQIRKF